MFSHFECPYGAINSVYIRILIKYQHKHAFNVVLQMNNLVKSNQIKSNNQINSLKSDILKGLSFRFYKEKGLSICRWEKGGGL